MENTTIPPTSAVAAAPTPAARMHPLMAIAAGSASLASLAAVAFFAGILPGSHSTPAAAPVAVVAPAAVAKAEKPAESKQAPTPQVVHHHHTQPVATGNTQSYAAAPYAAAPHAAQAPVQYAPQQAAAPAATSGVGIVGGAVLGGLIGNQVGGGNGKTLATIAGAVGGGYLGNEVEKRVNK